jgi:D-sedoheptulose 7-phosphate isomerase
MEGSMDNIAHPHMRELVARYPVLAQQAWNIAQVTARLLATFRAGGKLLVCGNGGSAADADHIVGELMKSFRLPRTLPAEQVAMLATQYPADGTRLARSLQGGLPAISLAAHASLLTAVVNDTDAEMIFAQQVYALGKPGDIVLGISTSGNARNVINALRVARTFGLSPLGLCGASAAQMDDVCDIVIHVPETETFKVQELHLPVYHAICCAVEMAIFDAQNK